MDKTYVLKALADETRMNILVLLLEHNFCVRALAKQLKITEAAVSQHLKVLRETGLVQGEKSGYFMHYTVQREVLSSLAREIEALAAIERRDCSQNYGDCKDSETEKCRNHKKDGCTDGQKEMCHGHGDGDHVHGEVCHCKHQE